MIEVTMRPQTQLLTVSPNYSLELREPPAVSLAEIIDYSTGITSELRPADIAHIDEQFRRVADGETSTSLVIPSALAEIDLLAIDGLELSEPIKNSTGKGVRRLFAIDRTPGWETRNIKVNLIGYTTDPYLLRRLAEDTRNALCDGINPLEKNSAGRPQQPPSVVWPR